MRKTFSTILSITLLTASIVLSGCASAKSQNSPTDNAVVSTQAGKIRGSVIKSGFFRLREFPMLRPTSVLYLQSLWRNGKVCAMRRSMAKSPLR